MIKKILEKITSNRVRLRDLIINFYKEFLCLGFSFFNLIFLIYLFLSGTYLELFTSDFWAHSTPFVLFLTLAIYIYMVLYFAITILLQIYFLTTAFWLSKKYGRFCCILLIGIYLSVLFHLIPDVFLLSFILHISLPIYCGRQIIVRLLRKHNKKYNILYTPTPVI